MYSPADFPSRTRAAPAKKRMLSEQTGSSSFADASGFPTFCDSSSASSSACSSSAAASFNSSSARSPGVVSSHSGSAFLAACTARSTSSAEEFGTSAIVSPVAGLRTSIVSPPEASTHSPPTRFLCCETVTLILSSNRSRTTLSPSQQARIPGEPHGDGHGDQGQQDDDEDDDVDLREIRPLANSAQDPQRESVLGPGREVGDDHLVEREREGKEGSGHERGRQNRQRDVTECLQTVGTQVHRGFRERAG